MVKNIWHTTEQKPEDDNNITFYVEECLYSGYYIPEHNQYGIFGASKVEKWCYTRELSSYIIALEEENEAMREEFEVWHGNYKCEVEEKERLQKGLEDIKNQLEYRACLECKHCNQHLNAIEILKDVEPLIKGNQLNNYS